MLSEKTSLALSYMRLRISHKIALTFLVTLILPIAIVNYYVHVIVERSNALRVLNSLQFGMNYVSTVIDENLLEKKVNSRRFVEDPRLIDVLQNINENQQEAGSRISELMVEFGAFCVSLYDKDLANIFSHRIGDLDTSNIIIGEDDLSIAQQGLYYGATIENLQSEGIVVSVIMPMVQVSQSNRLVVISYLIDAKILYYIKKISRQDLTLIDRRRSSGQSEEGYAWITRT